MDQNFYEILEIPPDATGKHIERAYRIARATYQPASVATYPIFSDEDNLEILRRIEEAYAVLSDARLRREYDARLRREGIPESHLARPAPAAPTPRPRPVPPAWARLQARGMEIEFDVPDEPEDGVYGGPTLRRVRINRGIEIEEISSITKINETYLGFIEADRYADLPPAVYLRGFLREVAKCLKLDPRLVVDTYMARYREKTGGRA